MVSFVDGVSHSYQVHDVNHQTDFDLPELKSAVKAVAKMLDSRESGGEAFWLAHFIECAERARHALGVALQRAEVRRVDGIGSKYDFDSIQVGVDALDGLLDAADDISVESSEKILNALRNTYALLAKGTWLFPVVRDQDAA